MRPIVIRDLGVTPSYDGGGVEIRMRLIYPTVAQLPITHCDDDIAST
jgi:hypothetical protein